MAAITSETNLQPSSQRLRGKVALVTGGATGIGECIVRLFHKHGAKVCLVDINDDVGQRVHESLGDNASSYYHCDVSKEEDVQNAVDFTVQTFGGLDIMVNNAGIMGPTCKDIRNINISDFEQVFDINVKGAFLGMKHAARIMIPLQKGSVISLCSVVAVIGGIGPHAYAASKNAILGLTKNVAAELGKHGIRVNCVSPLGVATNLSLSLVPEELRANNGAGYRASRAEKANLKGVELSVDDVANAVLFLASDEARYISGENLMIDGGFTAVNHSYGTFR